MLSCKYWMTYFLFYFFFNFWMSPVRSPVLIAGDGIYLYRLYTRLGPSKFAYRIGNSIFIVLSFFSKLHSYGVLLHRNSCRAPVFRGKKFKFLGKSVCALHMREYSAAFVCWMRSIVCSPRMAKREDMPSVGIFSHLSTSGFGFASVFSRHVWIKKKEQDKLSLC